MQPGQKLKTVAIGGAVVVVGLGTAAFAAHAGPQDGVLPDGIRCMGADWSGKTVDAARAELADWRKARLAEPITLALPPAAKVARRWSAKRAELGADVDVDATLAAAESSGQPHSFVAKLRAFFSRPEPVTVTPRWKVDGAVTRTWLAKRVAPAAQRTAKNARLDISGESFHIEPGRPGSALDLDRAVETLQSGLPTAAPSGVIELPVKLVQPHVSEADLKGIEGEVSRFETHYGETGNRARNIEAACRRINGTVLKPGDTFSYNAVVGPRDEDAGFHMAPVIINGKLVPGMGGGVCQTSTTLYNAALLADMKIVQRSHHAFPVHYIAPGRDATVSYGDKDLRFQNNTSAPLAIAADGTGGRVLMRLFGKKAPGREVRIERTNVSSWGPEVETVRDSSLAAGARRVYKAEAGHAGHRVTVWRIVSMNGHEVRREILSRDHYDSFPRLVHVGTRQVASHRASPAHAAPSPAAAPAPGTPAAPAPGGTATR